MIRLSQIACIVAFLLLTATAVVAQTGKIAGTVTDAETGDPLPGVNVAIESTTQGATTNSEGYYVILNVAPGTYNLRASFVGFASTVQEGARVNIDLTTEVDFELQEQTEQLEEITVQATEPVVKRDISANVANLSAETIENVPVASIEEVIELQAGIEPGLSVRGSNASEVALVVDGMSMRGGRDNQPSTSISYTSIKEVQVQTGGFSAEYGNVRSGLVNVVTKEGPRDRYTADVILRYSPARKEYFGMSPKDPDAYWMRPYLDSDVAMVGTHSDESPWDRYTQQQYPRFQGWNQISKQLLDDDDPTNDLTPTQLQEVYRFYTRKSLEVSDPDYVVDGSLGGPVPLLSKALGDLRFSASYRQNQDAYFLPQVRDSYRNRVGQLKLTSDLSRDIKLQVQGLFSKELGLNPTGEGWPEMWRGKMPAYPWSNRGMATNLYDWQSIFANDNLAKMDVARHMIGGELTHSLNANTFYEARLQRTFSDYFTRPGRQRRDEIIETIGGHELDEAPLGWEPSNATGFGGFWISGSMTTARDTSKTAAWTGSFDLTSQVNQYAMVKAGVEYIYNNHHMNFGEVDSFNIAHDRPKYRWDRQPRQGAAYAQTKLEFEGMVANLGLRLDYFNPGGQWYTYDPFSQAFSGQIGADNLDTALEQVPVDRQFSLSPRLGVSYPVTDNSKLYFNYGHFRQMLDPTSMFAIEKSSSTGAVGWIGNPNHPLPKTVAYEVGYEHNLLDQFLVRLAGYYKSLSSQPRQVTYTNLDGTVNYHKSLPYNYGDIRGAELSIAKNTGRWVRGFVNFTYMAAKRGNFGFARQFESVVEQRQFERESRAHYQSRPVPEPYARASLELLAPEDLGPEALGMTPLGAWHLSFLGEWRAGQTFTWDGGGGQITGLQNNVQWTDYYNLDLRLGKDFSTAVGDARFFVDVSNVLNLRQMYRGAGFQGSNDYRSYMQSLHLPGDTFEDVATEPYGFIPGDDRPGDYRKPGVEFVPIEVGTLPDVGNERALYYEPESGSYMAYESGSWKEADSDWVNQVLEDKAYIDMPNESYFTFLKPRRARFGIRVTL